MQHKFKFALVMAVAMTIMAFTSHYAFAQSAPPTGAAAIPQVFTYLTGVVWAGIGWAAARIKQGQAFDPGNFLVAVIIGIVLAAIAQFAGTDIATVQTWSLIQVITVFADKLGGKKTGLQFIPKELGGLLERPAPK